MPFTTPGDLANVVVTDCDSIVPGTTISTDTTTDGNAVDCDGADDHITGVFLTGNAGDASTVITLRLVECATSGGSYTAISGAEIVLTASATANDNLVKFISTRNRSLRYVKCRVVTSGGGTPSVPVAACVIARKKISGGNDYVT